MRISINNWKLEASLNALVHCKTGEIQRLGEFHFILLDTLATHAGEVLTRSYLINEVWKNRVVGNNSLPTAIYALRVALGDDGKLQEIIKTIPKKGYMLNKYFITEIDEISASEKSAALGETPQKSLVEENADKRDIPESSESFDAACISLVSSTKETTEQDFPPLVDKKNRSVKKRNMLIFLTVFFLISVFSGMAFYNRSIDTKTIESADLKLPGFNISQENTAENGQMKIFHLHRVHVDKRNELLSTHVRETLSHINQLLTERDVTLTIYYYSSIPKLSVDILLKNRCEKEYQLIMGINNWQSNTNALGTLIYQEVERTLNEMPACH